MTALFQRSGLFAILLMTGCSERLKEIHVYDEIYEGIEFEMPAILLPEFPDFTVSITEFGAVSDGQTLNTEAFSKAIQKVNEHGGGRVIIPRGIWLTGPIILKSNIDMHAEEGALVIFSKNKNLYPLIESYYEGRKAPRCLSPITVRNLENVAFTGEGIYDGSGEAWRKVQREKITDSKWEELLNSGGVVSENGKEWYPSESYRKGESSKALRGGWSSDNLKDYLEAKDFYRPVMVSLINSNNILLDGPVFQNSPAWCIHPLMCENLTVRNIDVRNPYYSENGDGIDIESCKNSVVHNCTFDVGDDAICIKSGKDQEGRDRGIPTENLIVKNCVVFHAHGGVTVGSEMSGGVKNVHVSNCTFIGTDAGLRFKSRRGRGGVVEKIYISHVDMIDIQSIAISFNLYYGGLSVNELFARNRVGKNYQELHEVTEETPQFKDIYIRNITCKGAKQAIYLQGLPEMNLENMYLEDLVMESEKGLVCADARRIVMKSLELVTAESPVLAFFNAGVVDVEALYLSGPAAPAIFVDGAFTEQISIQGKANAGETLQLVLGETVNNGSVQIR